MEDAGGKFAADLSDEAASVVRDFTVPSRALLVAFGGMAGALAMAPFEFFHSAGSLRVKRMFIRDLDQCWYQRGVRGMGDDVRSTADALRAELAAADVDRIVFTGNSAGGYAALLFGYLAGADAVVAFSPQTMVTRWRVRSRERIDATYRAARDRELLDLARVFRRPGPDMHIYYARWNGFDRMHARRLRRAPGITLHPHTQQRHGLVRTLRDRGELGTIFREALAGR